MQLEMTREGEQGWGGLARGVVDTLTLNLLNGVNRRCFVLFAQLHATADERAIIDRYNLGGCMFKGTDHWSSLQIAEGGFDLFVGTPEIFGGVRIKIPPEAECYRVIEHELETAARGLNNAVRNRANDALTTSTTIDLDGE